jgi:hypothetical protein
MMEARSASTGSRMWGTWYGWADEEEVTKGIGHGVEGPDTTRDVGTVVMEVGMVRMHLGLVDEASTQTAEVAEVAEATK